MTDVLYPNLKTRCKNCNKEKGHHRAHTNECPKGMKTRIGYTSFGPEVFDPKPLTKKQREKLENQFRV